MIRILIVDDQNLVQEGIKSLLEQEDDLKVVGTVRDGHTAVKIIDKLHPDVVLLDIEMPGMDGITATKYISRLAPETKVIILSSHEDKKYLTQALMAGAKAYVLKNSLFKDLRQSIYAVSNGFSQIESRLLAKIFDPSNLRVKSNKATQNMSNSAPAISDRGQDVAIGADSDLISGFANAESSDYLSAEGSDPTLNKEITAEFGSHFVESKVESADQTVPDQTVDEINDLVREFEEQNPNAEESELALEQEASQANANFLSIEQLLEEGEKESIAFEGVEAQENDSSFGENFPLEVETGQEIENKTEQFKTAQELLESQAEPEVAQKTRKPKSQLSSQNHSQLIDINSAKVSSVGGSGNQRSKVLKQKVPPSSDSKFLPAAIIQRSSPEANTIAAGTPHPILVIASKGKSYLDQWGSKPQIAPFYTKVVAFNQVLIQRCQPLTNFCQKKWSRYQVRISPVVKHWYEEGWLTNIGFWILGVVMVLLIHQILF